MKEPAHAVLPDRYHGRLLVIGRQQARKQGLRGEDIEDCASGFRLHVLLTFPAYRLPSTAFGKASFSEAYLYRSAANWARNRVRYQARRAFYEASASWQQRQEAEALSLLLLQELRARIRNALTRLSPLQRHLFVQYYLAGHSVATLARQTRRSPGAIRQALWVLRRRVRALLEQQGVDEAEACDYLALLQQGASQRPERRSSALAEASDAR